MKLSDIYCEYDDAEGTHVFYLDEVKAYDLRQLSKAIDIAMSRLIYPSDMPGWFPGIDCIAILVRPDATNDFPGNSLLSANLVALRYLFCLFKAKVAEQTSTAATTNDDVAWHTAQGIGE